MNKITLYVNRSQQKADGTSAIYVATVVNGQPVRFHTGICAAFEAIDFAKGGIRGRSSEIKDKNLIISSCRARISDIFVRYRLRFSELTPELLRREYDSYQSSFLFYDYAMKKLNERKLDLAHETYKKHRSMLKKINRFSPNMRLSDITEQTTQELVRWCKQTCKNGLAGTHNTYRVFKYYFRRALRENLVKGNPFENVKARPNIAVREYLSPDELQKLIDFYKKNMYAPPLQNVLRYFLFSCLTGLRYSDIVNFSHSNIVGSTIVVQMQKTKNETGKTVKIPLTKGVEQLIRDSGARRGEKIFRVISNQKTNAFLKEITQSAGIEKPITFHCARHTFATSFLAKNRGDLATLQELLGHAKVEQTRIYAHIIYEDTAASMQFFNDFWEK
jgi:site-specific recombinase XerD